MADEVEKNEDEVQETETVEAAETEELETDKPKPSDSDEDAETTGTSTEGEEKIEETSKRSLGILSDLQAERKKVKELRERLKNAEAGRPQDDDEFVTVSELKASLKDAISEVTKTTLDSLQEAAESRHSAEAEGPGLDWKSAYDAFQDMCVDDPGLSQYILGKANAPEAMYQFVQRNHPDFIRKLETKKNAKETRRLSDLANEATRPGGGGTKKISPRTDVENMSDEQLEKQAPW